MMAYLKTQRLEDSLDVVNLYHKLIIPPHQRPVFLPGVEAKADADGDNRESNQKRSGTEEREVSINLVI